MISRKKSRLKSHCCFILPIIIIGSLILLFEIYEQSIYESFQNFKYPSQYNFHEILNIKDVGNLTKLNDYEPRLLNDIEQMTNKVAQVVVIVKSAIAHVTNRDNIRRTWATKMCQSEYNISVSFALGYDSNGDLDGSILKEAGLHKDILRFNFVDTYVNNTYKVMAIMDHFVKFHPHASFLVIIDDDYFLDPAVLARTVTNQISRFEYDRYFGGYVWFHNMPQRSRSSKWFIRREDYQYNYYPPYATGGFLLISSPMVTVCHKLLPYLKYSPFDDVLLGILLFKLNIYPVHLKSVETVNARELSEGLLARHENSDTLIDLWQRRHRKNQC